MTDTARLRAILAAHRGREGALLPILQDVQAAFGFIPDDTYAPIAAELGLTRAEVAGVVGFYHDFRSQPHGRHVLKLCRAEACQSMGGDQVADRARALLGIDWHQTTPDGAVTLEPVFCLGLCACAPAALVDGRVVGRVDQARLDSLLDEVRA